MTYQGSADIPRSASERSNLVVTTQQEVVIMSRRDFEAIADMLFSTVHSDDDVRNFANKF